MNLISRLLPRSLRTRVLHDDRGQAIIEFAFVLPLLVILTLGMVEFARIWMQYQITTDAAREGARMVVIENDFTTEQKTAAVIAAVKSSLSAAGVKTSDAQFFANYCSALPTTKATTVEIYGCGWAAERNQPATVSLRVPYNFAFLDGFIGWTGDQARITLSTSFVMRNE